MLKSTTIIAFDQHAATTVAAVLLPGHRTPALDALSSDSPTILRFVDRLHRQGAVTCCYEAGPCGFELRRASSLERSRATSSPPRSSRGDPAIASKRIGATPASWPCSIAPGR
jgi:hypothetical protein